MGLEKNKQRERQLALLAHLTCPVISENIAVIPWLTSSIFDDITVLSHLSYRKNG